MIVLTSINGIAFIFALTFSNNNDLNYGIKNKEEYNDDNKKE